MPGCSSSSRAESLGWEPGAAGTSVLQSLCEPQNVQEPEQPITFRVLQRGQRISSDSSPHDGQTVMTDIYATPSTPSARQIRPPTRIATAIDPANRPAKYPVPRSLRITIADATHGTNRVIVTMPTSS